MAEPAAASPQQRDDLPLYSSRITSIYLALVRRRYPAVDVADLLRYAEMETYQVEDAGHWFSQRQVNRFQERLRQLTGNPGIAREAGRFTASPELLGGIKRYILGLATPARAYALLGHFVNKFTRSSAYVSRSLGPQVVELTVTPRPGVREEPFQCENRLGHIEAISRLFQYRPPVVEHPECLFRGDARCRYLITFEPSPAARWRRVRNLLLPLLALAVAAAWRLHPAAPTLGVALPAAAALYLAVSWYAERQRSRELAAAVASLEGTSDELLEQHRLNYENALMINEIGQTLSHKADLEAIVASVSEILRRRLDFDRGLILLANDEKTRLVVRGGFGYETSGLDPSIAAGGFHLDRPDARGVFVATFREQRPVLVSGLDEIRDGLSPRSLAAAERLGVQSFICCPIVYEEEALGVLAVDNVRTKRPLLQRDMNLLMGVAPQIAVCIHNVRLRESRLRQFESLLQVLVASTEARDPITAGHSQKVTEYAVAICRNLGLPSDYTDMIRVAASLHDYGKIAIYDAILKKPGRLTGEEYEHVKSHVLKTREILERVHFEGIYREVPAIAGAHHEKVDGSGYPRGLRGDEIPLGARILAVADVFEALTSKRHYRDPMALEEALDELVANVGRHFEERCVEALVSHCNEAAGAAVYSYAEGLGRLRGRGALSPN